MYISIEERIKSVTNGKCPYKHKICDGLCNNCDIVSEVLYPESNTNIRGIAPSKQGYICTYEDLNILENMAMNVYSGYDD